MPANFCPMCGIKLNNIMTGIMVVEKNGIQKTVCIIDCRKMLNEGWRVVAIAKGLNALT